MYIFDLDNISNIAMFNELLQILYIDGFDEEIFANK